MYLYWLLHSHSMVAYAPFWQTCAFLNALCWTAISFIGFVLRLCSAECSVLLNALLFFMHNWSRGMLYAYCMLYAVACFTLLHALCCCMLYAAACFICCMLYAAACFTLLHALCCCVLYTAVSLMLLHALSCCMLYVSACFMLHCLCCYRLQGLCCCMLYVAVCFIILAACFMLLID